eukprot:TRINITY_DN2192_c0_g1_i1.p1 TRINITY_DN2192_c0_g1~~TRINITY_DN2192_c0_g1_i1.p1  ORF type:complete len:225 (-),score=61.07 TRINITY_DN2192_c0_g1_i1:253-927(-)
MAYKILRFTILISSLVLLTLCCLTIIGYSIYQTLPNDKTDKYSINCEKEPYEGHHPIRFYVDGDKEALVCPWPAVNSSARIIFPFFSGVFFILSIYFSFYKKKKWFVWLTGAVIILTVVILFALLILDANEIRLSSNWCKKNPTIFTDGIDCSYLFFISMTFVEAACIIIFTFIAALFFYFGFKYMEDDFTNWDLDYNDENDPYLGISGAGAGAGYLTDDGGYH